MPERIPEFRAARTKEGVKMENPASTGPFQSISDKEWFEILYQWQQPDATRTFWVTIRHMTILHIGAIQCQLQVGYTAIDVLLPPKARLGSPSIGVRLFRPRRGLVVYEKRENEEGEPVTLRMRYKVRRWLDPVYLDLTLEVATDEEFLSLPEPDVPVQ
jgi:hypothetical protein